MSKKVFFTFLIYAVLSFGLSCSLKMGSPLSGGTHLHLRVKNDSLAPLLGPKVDRELRKKFLRNGSFILVNDPEDADTLLTITLQQYSDTTEAYRPGDTLLAAGLKLGSTALIKLEESGGGIIYENWVSANASFLLQETSSINDSSKWPSLVKPDDSMALQALAENLASKITVSLLNQAW